ISSIPLPCPLTTLPGHFTRNSATLYPSDAKKGTRGGEGVKGADLVLRGFEVELRHEAFLHEPCGHSNAELRQGDFGEKCATAFPTVPTTSRVSRRSRRC